MSYVDDLIARGQRKDAQILALREENARLKAQVAGLLIEHQRLTRETAWTADPDKLAQLRDGL